MSDKEWLEKLRGIKDPREMLIEIRNFDHNYGWDSYYKDLIDALWEQTDKVIKIKDSGTITPAWANAPMRVI
jgi:hypothetical protein